MSEPVKPEDAKEPKVIVMVAEVNPDELACIIAEGVIGSKRPAGLTAKAALADFTEQERVCFHRAAFMVYEYFQELMKTMVRPS